MCLFPAMEVVALSMNVAEAPHAEGVLLLDPSRQMHIRFLFRYDWNDCNVALFFCSDEPIVIRPFNFTLSNDSVKRS